MHYPVQTWNYEIAACLTDNSVWIHHIYTDDALVMWHLYVRKNKKKVLRVEWVYIYISSVIYTDIFLFAISFVFCSEITCVWVLNLGLIYWFLQQLTRSRTAYCITRCEKIIEYTGTPVIIDEKDNWIYWDTCNYWWKRQLNILGHL